MTPLVLRTPEDTRALGRALAGLAVAGDLIVATGPLGAGKTVLAQGIGAGLGVRGPVLSPTFVIARQHPGGRLPLVHVDAYRLGGIDELDDLDLDTDIALSVTVVEWGAELAPRMVTEHLEVVLARAEVGETRTATLRPSGPGWERRIARINLDR